MPTQRLVFTDWLPDQPSNAGSLNDAKNVYPVGVGYAPFTSAEVYSGAASEALNSVFVARYNNDVTVFAGGPTKLFKLNNTDQTLADVSKAGGYTGTGIWKFEQFGAVVLATNSSEKIQAWTVGTSTVWADVAATAPIAKDIAIVRDFVFAGNLTSGALANTVKWSDINLENVWTSGSTSQSDSQVIPKGGNVQAITGGEFGLIFLQSAVIRASYVGSPLFFQFDTISDGLGCLEGNSVAQYGNLSFFLSDDGWYSTDGQSVTNIGLEKVDRYFFGDADLTKIETISVAVDPVKNLVVWNYANNTGTRSLLIYNWQLQKWTRGDTVSDVVGTIATTGTTLEGLTSVLGYTDIDAMTASLDSRLFIGGKLLFSGTIDTKIAVFTGLPIVPQIITTDVAVGNNSVVTLARPQIDNGSADVAVASRRDLNDVIVFSADVETTSEGRASLRSAGRYHRLSIKPTGNWTTAMAVDVDFISQGNR